MSPTPGQRATTTAVRPGKLQDRLVWADALKAVCILLVVLYHVLELSVRNTPGLRGTEAAQVWATFTSWTSPVRMPLFFAVSGFFAARAVQRPWRAVWRLRLAQNVYLHVLWLLVGWAVVLLAGPLMTTDVRDFGDVALAAVTGYSGSGPWYLFALATYFAVTKLVLARAGWPVTGLFLAALAVLAVLVNVGLVPAPGRSAAVLGHAFFFAAGVVAAPVMTRFTGSVRWGPALLLVGLYLAVLTALHLTGTGEETARLVRFPLSCLGVSAGLAAAVALTRAVPSAVGGLARLGPWTLPVYLLHRPLLVGLHELTGAVFGGRDPGRLVSAAYVPLAAAALVIASLLVHAVLVRAGATWLFALPAGPARAAAGAGVVAPRSPLRSSSATTSDGSTTRTG